MLERFLGLKQFPSISHHQKGVGSKKSHSLKGTYLHALGISDLLGFVWQTSTHSCTASVRNISEIKGISIIAPITAVHRSGLTQCGRACQECRFRCTYQNSLEPVILPGRQRVVRRHIGIGIASLAEEPSSTWHKHYYKSLCISLSNKSPQTITRNELYEVEDVSSYRF